MCQFLEITVMDRQIKRETTSPNLTGLCWKARVQKVISATTIISQQKNKNIQFFFKPSSKKSSNYISLRVNNQRKLVCKYFQQQVNNFNGHTKFTIKETLK